MFHSASVSHAYSLPESPVASGAGAWPVGSVAEAHQASAAEVYILGAESYSLDRTGAFPVAVGSVVRPETADSAADQKPPERHRARLVENVATSSGATGDGSTFDPIDTLRWGIYYSR